MFMRFVGGGIGHKATDYLQERTPTGSIPDEAPDPQIEDAGNIPQNTQDRTQDEEVDIDEEADYGYADDCESKSEDSEGEDPAENDDSDDDLGDDSDD
jgi:hypothetical protein